VICQTISPINNYLNDCNRQSILGRIIRVTDDVIDYRNWIKMTSEHGLMNREVILTTVEPVAPPRSGVHKYHQQSGQQMLPGNVGDGHGFRRSSISSDDISESDESDDQQDSRRHESVAIVEKVCIVHCASRPAKVLTAPESTASNLQATSQKGARAAREGAAGAQ